MPVLEHGRCPMTRISKRRGRRRDGCRKRKQGYGVPRGEEMSMNEFFGDAPDEAAELYIAMWHELISGEDWETVARQSYSAAVVHVFSLLFEEVGPERAYRLMRAFETTNRSDWTKLDVILVGSRRGGPSGGLKDFLRRSL